jgi:energy-coupling factor transporter ATP-binding protein EcfA2
MIDFQFNFPSESIREFESPNQLPNLIVLTGKNGSGKTHILNAIKSGALTVIVDGTVLLPAEVSHVPFNGLNVTGGDTYSSQMAQQACQQIWGVFVDWRNSYSTGLLNRQIERSTDFAVYIQRFRNVNDPNNERSFNAITYVLRHESGIPLERLNKLHFWKNIFDPETSTNEVDFFEQNFAKLFAEYQVSLIKQHFYKYMQGQGYDYAPAVNDRALSALESNKPWDFVNDVLREAKFDFRVLPPDFWDTEEFDYRIRLKKRSSGAEVEFGQLSTGERVLFALALVRYKAEKRANTFPKVILLDEPDAPLHPAMTETMIEVLNKIFVDQYHTSVIMTTHSPATVALSKEDHVFTVKASDNPNKVTIMPASKQSALDELASGFVAISNEENQERVDFEIKQSRKPILFVEGDTDRSIIETAWKKIYPTEVQPFKTIACGNYDQVRHKIDTTTVEEFSDSHTVGVMDFDEAYTAFNGLKSDFSMITGSKSTCLMRTRPNESKEIICLLLPVPSFRDSYASKTLGAKSKLSIELLFTDVVLGASDNLRSEPQPGGAVVPVFQGNKSRFAKTTVPRLDAAEFDAFKPILEILKNKLT